VTFTRLPYTTLFRSGGEDQPPPPAARRHVPEAEVDRGAALRYRRQVHPPAHVPHQQVRVEVLVPDLRHPPHAPVPDLLDHPAQVLAGGREPVHDPAAVDHPVHHSGPGQPLQAGRQQDRKSTRLYSSHVKISYAVSCLTKNT